MAACKQRVNDVQLPQTPFTAPTATHADEVFRSFPVFKVNASIKSIIAGIKRDNDITPVVAFRSSLTQGRASSDGSEGEAREQKRDLRWHHSALVGIVEVEALGGI